MIIVDEEKLYEREVVSLTARSIIAYSGKTPA